MNEVPHWCLLPAVGSGGDLHEAGKRGINIMCVGFPLSIADLKLIKMLIYSIFLSGLFDKYVMNMWVKTRCMASTTTYTKAESSDNICTNGWYRSPSTDAADRKLFLHWPCCPCLTWTTLVACVLYLKPFSDVAGNHMIIWFYWNKFFNGRFAFPHKDLQ